MVKEKINPILPKKENKKQMRQWKGKIKKDKIIIRQTYNEHILFELINSPEFQEGKLKMKDILAKAKLKEPETVTMNVIEPDYQSLLKNVPKSALKKGVSIIVENVDEKTGKCNCKVIY